VDTGRLLVRCDDRPGIVAAVSGFLHAQGANIHQSDQYSTDPEGGTFFLRMVFHVSGESETLARACGKSHLHNLEPEDLVALTLEASAMARVPLAGTTWIPGR